jgi:hypothetical protein
LEAVKGVRASWVETYVQGWVVLEYGEIEVSQLGHQLDFAQVLHSEDASVEALKHLVVDAEGSRHHIGFDVRDYCSWDPLDNFEVHLDDSLVASKLVLDQCVALAFPVSFPASFQVEAVVQDS